jgi:hypothetical protein
MNDLYYEKLEETDKKLEAITNWRNRKFVKLNKKIDKVINKAGKRARKAMAEVGATIPNKYKTKQKEQ